MHTGVKMCVGISGVLTDSVFVLMCVDVCLRLCLFVRNKAVVCQNFRNGDERKQHLHDILTKRRIISLLLVMAQDWFKVALVWDVEYNSGRAQWLEAGPPKWR